MSKRIRSWLFIAFIVLFVIGTILISLYASGYKINLGWPPQAGRLLIKTGMIIVDSQPSGAAVYLNDEPQAVFSLNPWQKENITTAAKLRNIPPGEYLVRLERDGYWSWEKRVRVYPNKATTLSDINLFRQDTPQLLTESPEGPLAMSADKSYLYISSQQKIITLQNQEEITLPGNTKKPGYWLKNSSSLLADSQLFDVNGKNTDYQLLIGTSTTSVLDEDTNRLYYEKNGAISYLDLNSQAATTVSSDQAVLSYQPRNGAIFVLALDKDKTVLKKLPLPAGPAVIISELPSVGKYSFVDSQGPLLSLYDSQNKTLYLINEETPTNTLITLKGVSSWQWTDNNTLLYNNDWEIFRFDLPSNQSHLLTRVGEEIRQIIWHAEKNYILFTTTNSLQIYDPQLETTTNIFQTDKLSAPVLNADDDTLYFWAQTKDQTGVYKLLLQ